MAGTVSFVRYDRYCIAYHVYRCRLLDLRGDEYCTDRGEYYAERDGAKNPYRKGVRRGRCRTVYAHRTHGGVDVDGSSMSRTCHRTERRIVTGFRAGAVL